MRWLQELKAGVFDRLRMPAWQLLWVVVLVAATPWLRHEGATAGCLDPPIASPLRQHGRLQ